MHHVSWSTLSETQQEVWNGGIQWGNGANKSRVQMRPLSKQVLPVDSVNDTFGHQWLDGCLHKIRQHAHCTRPKHCLKTFTFPDSHIFDAKKSEHWRCTGLFYAADILMIFPMLCWRFHLHCMFIRKKIPKEQEFILRCTFLNCICILAGVTAKAGNKKGACTRPYTDTRVLKQNTKTKFWVSAVAKSTVNSREYSYHVCALHVQVSSSARKCMTHFKYFYDVFLFGFAYLIYHHSC